MTDRYRISSTVENQHVAAPAETRRTPLRTALWIGLFVSAAANATLSSIGVSPFIGVGFGLVALGCIAGLIVHHYKSPRH
ncbi:hypothetical protein [Kribbella sp. CA-293567]|uniref:hypothetical protein n=1 Tax=Kribbella sp. CA-293567 TaxID=3002436 RepID=UPI0022DD5FEF|nr:hypothetical protein [Kribbella sp. CA-293567]WBQ02631.1 hypothetical protein OX958_21895 [Kribbella sp. CA-293567]